ncbi:hypothetical protein [Sphingobium cloacae]|uniref:hypothetical protein n=1 Tax=Sphingobium cloacae TaxID=120107 RepID=UPI001E3DCFF6|nr:hypothetical protein [Sphingobium cloacae]
MTDMTALVTSNTPAANDLPAMITLDQLAREMKIVPREARMMLRLAAKQVKVYPNLGKDHVARQPWQWAPGSKALEEAKKALASMPDGK